MASAQLRGVQSVPGVTGQIYQVSLQHPELAAMKAQRFEQHLQS